MYGYIIGYEELDGRSIRYRCVVYSRDGIHGIDEFTIEKRHKWHYEEIVRYVWLKRKDTKYQYPVIEEKEKEEAKNIYEQINKKLADVMRSYLKEQ